MLGPNEIPCEEKLVESEKLTDVRRASPLLSEIRKRLIRFDLKNFPAVS